MSTDIGAAPGAQADSVWFTVGWCPLYRNEFSIISARSHLNKNMGDEKTGPSEVGLGKHRRPHPTSWWEELSI